MSERMPVHNTLVLVTDQFSCERIIKAARVIADLSHTCLQVLSVVRPGVPANPQALEHLFAVAKEYDARMTVEFSDNPQSAIAHFIRDNHVVNAITGIPDGEGSILVRMWKTLLNVRFFTVSANGELHEVLEREYRRQPLEALH